MLSDDTLVRITMKRKPHGESDGASEVSCNRARRTGEESAVRWNRGPNVKQPN